MVISRAVHGAYLAQQTRAKSTWTNPLDSMPVRSGGHSSPNCRPLTGHAISFIQYAERRRCKMMRGPGRCN